MVKKIILKYKKELAIAIFILLIAGLLRFIRTVLSLQPVFADEAIYIRWAQIMRAEPTMRFIPLSDGKQPLYMWCIIPFLKIISDPLIAGRMVSVFSGMLSLVGIGIFSYLMFSSTSLALIASLVYAISPFFVFFDSMALADSMLTMFGIWSAIFGLLTFKTLRLDYAMLTGFCLGAAMLTKSPAIYFLILLPVFSIFLKYPKKLPAKVILIIKVLFLLSVIYLLTFGIFNILRLGPNFHMIGLRNKDYVFPLSQLWTNPKDPFIFHLKDVINWLWIMGPTVVLILIPLGIVLRFREYFKEVFILAVFTFVPLFANAMYAKVFTARYILFLLPYLYILASIAFKNMKLKSSLFLLLAGYIVTALAIDILYIGNIKSAPLPKSERTGYLEEWTSGYGIWEISDYLKTLQAKYPNDKIIVGTEGYFGTLPDGLQMYLADYPEITVIGVGLDLKEVPLSLKESKSFGNRTFLVINDSRLKAKPQDLGLTLLAIYPKALRTIGTAEYNLFGPRQNLLFFEVN